MQDIPDETLDTYEGYRHIAIPFTDKLGEAFTAHVFDFDTKLGDCMQEALIAAQVEDAQRIADIVFPNTNPGEPLYEMHKELIDGTNSLVVIRHDLDQECVAFYYNHRYSIPVERNTLSLIDLDAGGVDPNFDRRGILQRATVAMLKVIPYDIITGTTLNPAAYISTKRIAEAIEYSFFPESYEVDEDVVTMGRKLLSIVVDPEAANNLDSHLVRRNYLAINPQKDLPFYGYPYFEDQLQLGKADGVYIMIIKPLALQYLH